MANKLKDGKLVTTKEVEFSEEDIEIRIASVQGDIDRYTKALADSQNNLIYWNGLKTELLNLKK